MPKNIDNGGSERSAPETGRDVELSHTMAASAQVEAFHYSQSLIEAAEELGKDVEAVTPADLIDSYEREDLPEGPISPLGGEQPSHLRSRSESETRRLAGFGRARVERSIKARGRLHAQ